MTGSFTCMTLTALLIFDDGHSVEEKAAFVTAIRQMGESVLEREHVLQQFVDLDYNRVIYLGSGPLAGLAREVQLKILELTAGKLQRFTIHLWDFVMVLNHSLTLVH